MICVAEACSNHVVFKQNLVHKVGILLVFIVLYLLCYGTPQTCETGYLLKGYPTPLKWIYMSSVKQNLFLCLSLHKSYVVNTFLYLSFHKSYEVNTPDLWNEFTCLVFTGLPRPVKRIYKLNHAMIKIVTPQTCETRFEDIYYISQRFYNLFISTKKFFSQVWGCKFVSQVWGMVQLVKSGSH